MKLAQPERFTQMASPVRRSPAKPRAFDSASFSIRHTLLPWIKDAPCRYGVQARMHAAFVIR
jgi:hypothetical protein